jgi:leucyl/phenylalanyl-tRNA---protein transferase
MSMLSWLNHDDAFPDASRALKEPNGLLAAGADLSVERLLSAYRAGVFPWSSKDEPILWWSPDPRCVVFPEKVHISKSLKKHLRKHPVALTFDQAFPEVIQQCSREDENEDGWITDEMKDAYTMLHKLGHAHSVEVWRQEELIGGLYGVSLGRCFFGESMFSLEANASKIAFAALCKQLARWNFPLIDCQIENPHLLSLGAEPLPRNKFIQILDSVVQAQDHSDWMFDSDICDAIAG